MDTFDAWMTALEARQLAHLDFREVSRALRALSSAYVERRGRLRRGGALDGDGKRAAFALFYGPIHFLIVREIVSALGEAARSDEAIVDLGCGTGAAGAAWADACRVPSVLGVDQNPWALGEAAGTYRQFGLEGRTRLGDVAAATLPTRRAAFIAAFSLNEMPEEGRDRLLSRLVGRATAHDRLLILEPLARFVAPWWEKWRASVERAGGRADEWRFRVELPSVVAKLDRAVGLDHRELTARSLFL